MPRSKKNRGKRAGSRRRPKLKPGKTRRAADSVRQGSRRTTRSSSIRRATGKVRPARGRQTDEQALRFELRQLRAYCRELDRELAKSKRANDTLRRTLSSYRRLFSETLNPIFVVGRQGRFMGANAAALKFTESSLTEMKKKRAWDFAPPGKKRQYRQLYSLPMTRRTVESQFLVNGKLKTLVLSLLPLTLGKFHLLFAIGQDLTERKRAEEALRDTVATTRALIEAPDDTVILVDRAGTILDCNRAAANVFQKQPREIQGTTYIDLVPTELGKSTKRWFQKAFRTGRPVRFQSNYRDAYFDTAVYPIRDAAGNVVKAVAVARDITQLTYTARALAERETRLAEVQSVASLGSWEMNLRTRDNKWSDEQYRLFGYKPGEVEPSFEFFMSHVHPDDQPELRSIARTLPKRRRPYKLEFRVIRKDGVERWFHTRAKIVRDSLGKPLRLLGVNYDITELRETQTALAQKEASLAEAQAIARLGSWEHDVKTGTETWSNEQYRLFGHQPGTVTLSYEFFLGLVHPEDRERVQERVRAALDGRKMFDMEFRIVRPDGALRWFRSRAEVFRDSKGRPVRVAGTNLDVTELKQAEDAAIESAATARALFNAPTDAVIRIGRDGTLLAANDVAATIMGPSWPGAIGKPVYERFQPHVLEKRKRMIQTAFRGRSPVRYDDEHAGRYFDVTIYPVIHSQGDVGSVVLVAREVTELRRAIQEQGELRAQLLQAQKLESLGVLAGGIAHDFNNYLTSVLGHADLALMNLPKGSRARPALQEIMKTAQQASGLTNQMLAYSGKGQFVVKPIDLGKVLREMANMLEVSASRKASVKLDVEQSLHAIEAEEAQIRQVILNLVMNASEALGDSPGVISVSVGEKTFNRAFISKAVLGRHLNAGSYVYLEVRDTGCGMEPDMLDKVFDPFFTTKFAGRGLGLSAVLGIIKGHDGAIVIDSEPGKGTTFTVLFPPSDKPTLEGQQEKPYPKEFAGTGTILLAEDEDIVRRPFQRLLEGLGFDVLTAKDGKEAIDVFAAHQREIVCVLLDLTMPKMSGDEVFRELRRLSDDVKVILLSGYGETESIRRFSGRRPDGFIQKPYQLNQLVEKLREVLGRDRDASSGGSGSRS